MKSLTIKGSKRESVGKSASKALRDAGKVPCVLYGGNEGVIHFSALEKDFTHLVYTPDVHTVKLNLGGKTVNAVLQDIQFHPVTDAILHMDFFQFDDEHPIKMTLPVHATGVAAGVKQGGVLQFIRRRLEVEGLVDKLPDYIEVDVSSLKMGDNLTIEALLNDDYQFVEDKERIVCHVMVPRNLEALEPDLEEEEVPTEGDEKAATEEDEANTDA